MPGYKIFFYASLFFLIGVLLKSLGLGSGIVLITTLVVTTFLAARIFRKNKEFFWFAVLSLLIAAGALYYQLDDNKFNERNFVFGKSLEFSGVVVTNPVLKNNVREFSIELDEPLVGRVLAKTSSYTKFSYGDKLKLKGKIIKPFFPGYANYLAKNGVSGIVYFPEIEFLDSGHGSSLKAWLFSLRNRAGKAFSRVLSPPKAAFLNGLTFGGYSGFTEEFREAMSLSGTTHLVALSGYNIIVIISAAMGAFIYIFSRRVSITLPLILIVAFVIMTGAEASVVRAAVMGVLVVMAQESGRIFDVRNAIILAGLIMVLQNPKVLVFDIGFQLSFLALLGIVYLKPVLQKIAHMKESPGFLSWRGNLLTTTSAQLAVVPVLMINFGSFSPISLLANVAVLELIPITMFFGFVLVGVSFLSYYLSLVVGWIVWVLLSVEIGFIELFAKLAIPIDPNLGWGGAIVYYIVLVFVIYIVSKKHRNSLNKYGLNSKS